MSRIVNDTYVLPTYTRYDVVFERACGMDVWDIDGCHYLDFFPGWGVGNVGHCHPKVVAAVKAQVEKIMHVPNVYYSLPQGELAEKIVSQAFDAQVFFCNSGAEANEAAIKLARKRRPEKREIITLYDSFHGRTLGALSATGQPQYHQGFEPLVEGFHYCKINDCEALSALVNEKTAAIMLEPVQGEGGVWPLSHEFMTLARKLCDTYDALLIVDEVQTGIGRTGTLFGYEAYGIVPDVMTLAKALGGGLPIGAMVAKKTLNDVLVPGTHASTCGGNAVACAAGCAVFDILSEEDLLAQARKKGKIIVDRFLAWQKKYAVIEEVRGRGLMIGMALRVPGAPVVDACRKKGLLINCTHATVLRLMPALNVTEEQIDQALTILEEAIATEAV